MSSDVRVGISGWRYPTWRRVFYPRGLAQRRELEYASAVFRTVEINGSFYASGVLALDDKLGPILWQLPRQLGFDRAVLRKADVSRCVADTAGSTAARRTR
jgi:uncharacterized protein YecE (DUF72 family)